MVFFFNQQTYLGGPILHDERPLIFLGFPFDVHIIQFREAKPEKKCMSIQKVETFLLLSQLSGYKWLYIHNINTLYIHNVSIICDNSRGYTPIGELTMDWDGTMSQPNAHRRPNSCSFKSACFKVTHSQKSEHCRD